MSRNKAIVIRKERFYPHPPEDVWAALTDSRALAEWLEPNNHEPQPGRKFEFRCDPGICGSGVTECEVLEAEPRRRLVWSWVHVPARPDRERPAAMTIAWTLTAVPGGTRLVLEHSGAEHVGWLTRNMMKVGWGYMLRRLIPQVLGSVADGVFSPGAIPLSKRAYRCATIPDEFVR